MPSLFDIVNPDTTTIVGKGIGMSEILAKNSDVFNNFQDFRKLLANCSVTDNVSVNGVLEEIKTFADAGFNDMTYFKNPQKIACFSNAILGLSGMLSNEINNIYQTARQYKTSILPKFSEILSSAYKEFNPKIDLPELDDITSSLVDVGANYLLDIYTTTTATAETWVEDKAKNALKKVYSYIALLFTLSSEFKWLLYLVYIENLKTEIDNRINKLLDLKTAFDTLVLDINQANNSLASEKEINLQNYKEALTVVEDALFFNEALLQKFLSESIFDVVINDSIIGNIDQAKNLLIAQRNDYLEDILSEEETNTLLVDLNNTFILPENLSNTNNSYVFDGSTNFEQTDNILDSLTDIPFITVLKNAPAIGFALADSLEDEWFETKTKITSDYIDIRGSLYKITENIDLNPAENKFTSFFDNTDLVFLIRVQQLDKEYHRNNPPVTRGFLNEVLYLETPTDFLTKQGEKTIDFTNDVYEVTEGPTTYLNTILFTDAGLAQIAQDWGSSLGWSLRVYLRYSTGTRADAKQMILVLNSDYPSFMSGDTKIQAPSTDNTDFNIFAELPNPIRIAFDKYKTFNYRNLKSYAEVGSDLTTFLYGSDLIERDINKFGAYISSYNTFIKTANNVLEKFCPVKNTIFSFYSLLEQLPLLPSKDASISEKINKDWILKLNQLISATMRSMLTRNQETFEFATIEKIKDSSLYGELIPSLILDHQNLQNINKLLVLNKNLGNIFNQNEKLATKFDALIEIIEKIQTNNTIQKIKDTEVEMWASLRLTFASSLQFLIKGEPIDTLQTYFDTIKFKTDNVILELESLRESLASISLEQSESQIFFEDTFNDMGVGFIADFIKKGQFERLIVETSKNWLGKHGDTVYCLNKIANRYFSGVEKNYLLSVANYVKSLDIAEVLTLLETEKLNTNFSININFLNNAATETIEDLKNMAKRASHYTNSIEKLKEKENSIK